MTQEAAVEQVHHLLSEIIRCGANVTKVQYAANQVPKEGFDVPERPPATPSKAWRFHVRVRVDPQHVPRKNEPAFQRAMKKLDAHLKESGLGPQGMEKTPLDDHRFSVLLEKTDQTNDPFRAFFPPRTDRNPELNTLHIAPRLLQWFEKLKRTGRVSTESNDGAPFVMKVRVRTNTPKEKRSVRETLAELQTHLFEENDGHPAYEQVKLAAQEEDASDHRLEFHFPNRLNALPILNAIHPHGGYH